MNNQEVKIGKIIKIEGLVIQIEVQEKNIANKLTVKNGVNDFLVSINKLVYCSLPNGKNIIARINKIFDKNVFATDTIYIQNKEAYIIEAMFIGIYDNYLKIFDTGINTFPIIGSEIYSVNNEIYSLITDVKSNYRIQIGTSYNDSSLKVLANPDVLFGKHLGVFGNTGTGKSCTVASIIQGLKTRLSNRSGEAIEVKPKIVIFDANNEYEKAFSNTKYAVKKISKDNIFLPHYFLSYSEYYSFLGASQGVQAPALKTAIDTLREVNPTFSFKDLPGEIKKWIGNRSIKEDGNSPTQSKPVIDHFRYNQWYGWCSTMINRIETIIDDEKIINIIDTNRNTVEEIMASEEEIILIEADFDKSELDIIIFLFSKLMYVKAVDNKHNDKMDNLVILFEEAHRYISESDNTEYKLGSFYIERLAREGRKFGISLIISSQRPSELSRVIVSQCNSFIVHRITNKLDLEFIQRSINTNHNDLISYLSGLEKQYAIVFGEAFGYSDIIRIENAAPTPSSEDPELIYQWSGKYSL